MKAGAWVPIVSAFLALITSATSAGLGYLKSRRESETNADAAQRSMSWTEMEKTITFQSNQLKALREESDANDDERREQRSSIATLQRKVTKLEEDHERCERDKKALAAKVTRLEGRQP